MSIDIDHVLATFSQAESETEAISHVLQLLEFLGYPPDWVKAGGFAPDLATRRLWLFDVTVEPTGDETPWLLVELKWLWRNPGEVPNPVLERLRESLSTGAYASVLVTPGEVIAITRQAQVSVPLAAAFSGAAVIATFRDLLWAPDDAKRLTHLAQLGVTTRPPNPARDLAAAWARAQAATTPHEKGRTLEEFAAQALAEVPGVTIRYRNLYGLSQEIDILCRFQAAADSPFVADLGPYFLVECKNWSTPAGAPVLRDFLGKLTATRCKAGVFLSRNGVTGSSPAHDAAGVIRDAWSTNVAILVLDSQDLDAVADGSAKLGDLLERRYEALRFKLA